MQVSPFHLFLRKLLNKNIYADKTHFYLVQDISYQYAPLETTYQLLGLHGYRVLVSGDGID